MVNDILLIAGPEGHDFELVAAAAAHRPLRVTVLIDERDPNWGWSDTRAASARRDRLATLLSAVEQTTGAIVVGMVGEPAALELGGFDAVLRGAELLHAA